MSDSQADPVLDAMSRAQLKDALQAHRQFLAKAQQNAAEARQALISLGMELCGEPLDRLQKSGVDLAEMEPGALLRLIRENLPLRPALPAADAAGQLASANRRLGELQGQLEEQRQRAAEAGQRLAALEQQVSALEAALRRAQEEKARLLAAAAPPPPQAAASPESAHLAWLEQWRQSKSTERLEQIVLLLGESGISRYTEIEARLMETFQVSDSRVYALVVDCEKDGLVTRAEMTPPTRGRPSKIITLAERGRWLYQRLASRAPAEPDHTRLLRAHKSEAHLALVLRVADLFAALGYEVNRDPLRIEAAPGHFFEPDLLVRRDGESCGIEVERGDGDKPSLERKWENASAAGGGRIYLVADKPGTLNRLQSGIIQWATLGGRRVTLYKTHLEALRARRPGESPWLGVKEIGPR